MLALNYVFLFSHGEFKACEGLKDGRGSCQVGMEGWAGREGEGRGGEEGMNVVPHVLVQGQHRNEVKCYRIHLFFLFFGYTRRLPFPFIRNLNKVNRFSESVDGRKCDYIIPNGGPER